MILKYSKNYDGYWTGEDVAIKLQDTHTTFIACHRIKRCYRAAFDCALPPDRVTLKRIMVEQVDLYSYVPPPGTNIPISMEPFQVDESVPTEEEIEWAVKGLRNPHSRGPSGVRANHLKRWLAAGRKASKDETTAGVETTEGKESTEFTESTEPTEAVNWERVVGLVQMAFREGRLAEYAMWQAVALIPNGGKYYRGIGLMEVVWKVVAVVLNCWLVASITLHDFLQVFRAGRGTGTATLEAKLFQQLAALSEKVLHGGEYVLPWR